MYHVLLNGCATGIKVQSHTVKLLNLFCSLFTSVEFGGSIVYIFLFLLFEGQYNCIANYHSRGLLPSVGYIGISGSKFYGFSGVLIRNRATFFTNLV